MHYCDVFIESSCFNDFKLDSLKPYVYSKQQNLKSKMKLPMKTSTVIDIPDSSNSVIKPYNHNNNDSTQPPELFHPDKQDPLFWCIFVAIYGELEYFQLRNKDTNKMIEEKSRIGQHFAKSSRAMKDSNVKLTIKQIQMLTSDLMTNTTTNIELLTCYAIYYKRKIVVTKNQTYIQIIPDNTDGPPIYIDNQHGYGLHSEDVSNVQDNKIEIFSTEKPLKSVSTYKVSDLRDLAEKVQLNHISNGKQDLYDALNDKLKW